MARKNRLPCRLPVATPSSAACWSGRMASSFRPVRAIAVIVSCHHVHCPGETPDRNVVRADLERGRTVAGGLRPLLQVGVGQAEDGGPFPAPGSRQVPLEVGAIEAAAK